MSELQDVVARLKAKRSGAGWVARCPAHEDARESLSLREGRDGKMLLHCFAGCSWQAIRAALGLGAPPSKGEPLASYPYHDEAGRELYIVDRFPPKEFRIRQPNGKWGLGNAHRVPYRLPALRAACAAGKVVAVTEGEKDVESLRAVGITATTIHGGASATLPDGFATHFTGAKLVAVIPDNDEPGEAFAERVASALHASRVQVAVVRLPGLAPKGDVSDWLGAGGTASALKQLVAAAARWEPAAPGEALTPPVKSLGERVRPSVVVNRLTLSDVTPEDVQWLWPGYIPRGKLTVLEGDPGLSKSTLTLWLAARLSQGAPFPDGTQCEAADSLFITYEDGAADTVRPRAEAAGADLSRIHLLTGVSCNGDEERMLTLPDDIPAIRVEVDRCRARLVVVDPLGAALSGKTDTYRDQDMRRALAPLARLAEEVGAAVIVVRHLTKGSGRSAIMAGGGSIGIAGAARMVLAVHRHPDDDADADRRVLAVVKGNLSREAPSRSYRLVDTGTVARIEWGEVVAVTADELTAARSDEDRESRTDAKHFLRSHLEAAEGGKLKVDLVRDAAKEGIAARTLERASRDLRIRTLREHFGGKARWLWPRPTPKTGSLANSRQSDHIGKTGETGENGAPVESNGVVHGLTPDGDQEQRLTAERVAELLEQKRRNRAGPDGAAE